MPGIGIGGGGGGGVPGAGFRPSNLGTNVLDCQVADVSSLKFRPCRTLRNMQILSVASGTGGVIRVTTAYYHGLSTGSSVTISGVTGNGATDINGTWTINVLDRNLAATASSDPLSVTFDLVGTTYNAGHTYTLSAGVFGNPQSFSLAQTNGTSFPFLFNTAASSKFTILGWLRWDTVGAALPVSGAGIIACNGAAGNTNSWDWYFGTNGSSTNLILEVGGNSGTGTAGSFSAASKTWSNAFTNGVGNLFGQWLPYAFTYDGSQHGDDTKVAKVAFNGQQITTSAGTGLPQLVGNPSANCPLIIGFPRAGQGPNLSFNDVLIFNDVPASFTAMMADHYNGGFGLQFPTLPSSFPSSSALLAWYTAEDGFKADGSAPAGNLIDRWNSNSDHRYDMTANNSPGGELEVMEARDKKKGTIFYFGLNPLTGTRSRAAEFVYQPTGVAGKPAIKQPVTVSPNNPIFGFATAIADFKSLMGSAGSLYARLTMDNLITGNEWFTICDYLTWAGTAGQGTDRILSLGSLNQNTILKSMSNNGSTKKTNRQMLSLNAHHAEGNPATYIYSSTMSAVGSGTGGVIRVTLTAEHNCTNGSTVTISGVTGNGAADINGTWTVNRIDSTHVDLIGTTYNAGHTYTLGAATFAGPDWGLANVNFGIGGGGLPDNEVFGEPVGEVIISGAADNGSGAIRLTTATPHGFNTGDMAYVGNVHGVTNANSGTGNNCNPWTLTKISATQVDLQGSSIGGQTYSSTSNPPAVIVSKALVEYYYPTAGQGEVVNVIMTNINDGSYGQDGAAGPYRISRDGVEGILAVDDGGGGRIGNFWASKFEQLGCAILGGYINVVNGVLTLNNGGYSGTYTAWGIMAGETAGDRAAVATFLVNGST